MTTGVDIPELEMLLGGPLPLVARTEDPTKTSAVVLIRGGPGMGKTILATHIAIEAARQLGGDVSFACVELLPRELREQQRRILGDERSRTILVPPWGEFPRTLAPLVFASTLDLGDRIDPVATRERFETDLPMLVADAAERSARGIKAVVIDAVSDGYGLGAAAPRLLADRLAKYAADLGVILIIVEEATSAQPSPWSFAVDVVLDFVTPSRLNVDGGQNLLPPALRATKNRFGPALTTPSDFVVIPSLGPFVRPALYTYTNLEPARTRRPCEWSSGTLTAALGSLSGKSVHISGRLSTPWHAWIALSRVNVLVVRAGGWRSLYHSREPTIEVPPNTSMEPAVAMCLSVLRESSICAVALEDFMFKDNAIQAFAGVCAFRGVTLVRTGGPALPLDDVVIEVRGRDNGICKVWVERPLKQELAVPEHEVQLS